MQGFYDFIRGRCPFSVVKSIQSTLFHLPSPPPSLLQRMSVNCKGIHNEVYIIWSLARELFPCMTHFILILQVYPDVGRRISFPKGFKIEMLDSTDSSWFMLTKSRRISSEKCLLPKVGNLEIHLLIHSSLEGFWMVESSPVFGAYTSGERDKGNNTQISGLLQSLPGSRV